MSRSSTSDNVVRVQAEIRDEIDKERQRRYQRELKKSEELEETLNKLSSFSYTPVDYTAGLVRKQFSAPAIPDYSYLLTEARLKIVNKFYAPITMQLLLGLFFVILSLAFADSFVPILGIAGLAACAFSLHKDLRRRQISINNALVAARAQIEALVKEARENIDNMRRAFDEAEDTRIEKIEKLLNGDPGAVLERFDEVLSSIRLPFFLRSTIDFYAAEPVITFHLPDHSFIPTNIVTLTQAGNISYYEKSSFEVNKQYSEVLAGVTINIATLLFAHVPTLGVIYIQGLFDKWSEEEYYYSLKLNRQAITDVVECRSGLEAFRMLNAEFEVKTSGSFTLIQPVYPDWWENTPRERIRTITVACQQL